MFWLDNYFTTISKERYLRADPDQIVVSENRLVSYLLYTLKYNNINDMKSQEKHV